MDLFGIVVALILGVLSRSVGLPPLIGFLMAGFALKAFGYEASIDLKYVGELGVTLLLFTIGLKLRLTSLLRPQVWAVASLHMIVVVLLFGAGVYAVALSGLALFDSLDLQGALLVAFALSFSSTVFAVKVLEETGDEDSLHGRIAIGILIMQDLYAVLFLALSTGKMPSALGLVAALSLVLFRRLLMAIMDRCAHGELLVLFGIVVAIGGAQAFEAVGIKGDLGALFLGVLLAQHPKSDELGKTLFGFKDLFLVGFFLSIGLAAEPSARAIAIAGALVLLMPLKTALFFWLLTRLRLSARCAALTAFSLSNFSEFGLIVAGVATSAGWIAGEWLMIIAIDLSFTFLIASPLNARAHRLYEKLRSVLDRFEDPRRLAEEAPVPIGDARYIVFGMGRVGIGAYDYLTQHVAATVIGVDSDVAKVSRLRADGRNVVHGDASDNSFWDRGIGPARQVRVVRLTMSNHEANLRAVQGIREASTAAGNPSLLIGAAARFQDDGKELKHAGADVVLDFYSDAGSGLAAQILPVAKAGAALPGSAI